MVGLQKPHEMLVIISTAVGPIVCIGPDELHLNDPKYVNELYAGPGKPREKYKFYTQQFGYTRFFQDSFNLQSLTLSGFQMYHSFI